MPPNDTLSPPDMAMKMITDLNREMNMFVSNVTRTASSMVQQVAALSPLNLLEKGGGQYSAKMSTAQLRQKNIF